MDIIAEKKIVPRLRFSNFIDSWHKKKFGDVGNVKMCKRIFTNQTSSKGDIPFYKIGTFGKTADAFINIDLYEEYKRRFSYPKVGEILMSASGTLGRTVVYDGSPSYFQDSNIVWLENNESLITNKFLYYLYQIVRYESEGGTIQRLYNNIILNTKFYKPCLDEQNKIAEFLSSVDKKIQLLEKKKEQLELYKKGVMQKIFSREIRFKDENGNSYPDWEEKKLGEIVNLKHGYQFRRGDFTKEGLAIIKISNVIGNSINLKELSYINSNRYNEFKKFEISNGDILMSLTGNIGRVVEVKNLPFKVIQNYRVGNFIPIELNLYKPFLKYLLITDMVFGRFNKLSNQSAQPNFGKQDMDKINIKCPSIDEQKKIADFLSAIDSKIETTSTQIDKTKEFKKGLLQQMFV